MAHATMAEIARRAGVSKTTVSFALNGRPGVGPELRARILAIAAELDWHPSAAAVALSGAGSDLVGLVVARSAGTIGVEPGLAQLASGLESRLRARGRGLQLVVVEDMNAELAVYRRWAGERRIAGVVLVDLLVRDPRLDQLPRLGLPAVVVGGPGQHGALSRVWSDERDAMLSIVEYLEALGHRRIAHVAGRSALRQTQRRMRAFRDAAALLDLGESTSTATDGRDPVGASATRRLLGGTAPPTALIYDTDVMGVAGLGAAAKLGLSVPSDVSIVAFEDSLLARLTHPTLTALARDVPAAGAAVADALVDVLESPGLVRNVQLPTASLVVRASTGPRATSRRMGR